MLQRVTEVRIEYHFILIQMITMHYISDTDVFNVTRHTMVTFVEQAVKEDVVCPFDRMLWAPLGTFTDRLRNGIPDEHETPSLEEEFRNIVCALMAPVLDVS